MRLFHGTTYENYQSILENGFSPENPVWFASESNFMYFYNPQNFIKEDESDTMEDAIYRSIDSAFRNAKITGAIQKSKHNKLVVIEVNVNKKYISDDDSCPNMTLASKVNIDNLSVKNIKTVYTADFCYNMSLVYLIGLTDNDYINLDDFSTAELDMIKNLEKSGFYLEDDFCDWEEIEV